MSARTAIETLGIRPTTDVYLTNKLKKKQANKFEKEQVRKQMQLS